MFVCSIFSFSCDCKTEIRLKVIYRKNMNAYKLSVRKTGRNPNFVMYFKFKY